jgi:hypothetical protein
MKEKYEACHESEEVKSTERCIRPYMLEGHQRSHSDYIVTIKKSECALARYCTVCRLLLISSKEVILPDSTAISVLSSLDSLSMTLAWRLGLAEKALVTNACIDFLIFVLRSLRPCFATR